MTGFFRCLFFVILAMGALPFSSEAQTTFPLNGVADQREGLYAFTNATIFTAYNQRIDNATLLIRKGKVEAVGQKVQIPSAAVVIDLAGKFIYPSFIDLYTDYGIPAARNDGPAGGRMFGTPAQRISNKKGAYGWNEALKPEFRAHEVFVADPKTAKQFRDIGFGNLLSHQPDGISRGSSALVTAGDDKEQLAFVKKMVAHHLSFNKGSSRQDYPSSLMGSIALIRQTFYDAKWYQSAKDEVNLSLEAWNSLAGLPHIFEVNDRLDALRAAAIGREFNINFILKGTGDEYQRIQEIKSTGSPLILPLNFPEAYDVEDPLDAQRISLAQLKHWEMAPANPATVAAAGIPFAITTHGLRNKADFMAQLRKAIQYGLSETDALKALTHTPAQLSGAQDLVGSLSAGKMASFFISNGNIFGKDAKIYHHWINGKPHVIKDVNMPDFNGKYQLQVAGKSYDLSISGPDEQPELKIATGDTTSVKVKFAYDKKMVSLSFALHDGANRYRLSGTATGNTWAGTGQDDTGQWISWSATRTDTTTPNTTKKEDKTSPAPAIGKVSFPFGAYGWLTPPQAGALLITNATVWTNEAEGILPRADVLIRNGKIVQVGKNISAADATTIDGTGKHLTAGIIDEHSHIAASRGINEGTQVSSAEVRIGDILNSEDINIYRQLSGGVTSAQILHGSANPIGGQSAIIKLRWGLAPEKLKFEGAPGYIKFALGENVKQSSWTGSDRFPQTRMGVEDVFNDYFTRAREYGQTIKSGKPYRRDLDLETVLEILDGKRFITCHSYRQSEINMLMKVADKHGFRVKTFTHILEGYKVADKMAQHGAGGSSFSDWWAYKYEVYDAIPHNGAIMHQQGVTVAFNSDDAEMARRLNQEAAKAVLFGGVSEEDALKFVTLNPAKLLQIDHRVGSIKAGKDADLVIWSDHPLSVYAKAETTFVDGIPYFDRTRDAALRADIQTERHTLIQKMVKEKQGGGRTQPVMGRQSFKLYHCEDLEGQEQDHNHTHSHHHH